MINELRATPLARYAAAVVLVALAATLTWLSGSVLRPHPASLFFAAVALTAWFGGRGPGLVATALAVFIVDYFFVPPFYTLTLSLESSTRMSVLVLVALLISSLMAQRRRAEERLNLYRKIVAHSNEAIAIVDLQGRYIEQNETHRRLLGYDDAELADQTPALHMGGEPFARVAERLGAGEPFVGEVVSHTKQGTQLHLDLSAFVVRADAGTPVCYVGIKRDVTARRQAAEQLREQSEVIETVNRIGQVLSAELDLQKLVQAVTDAATELSGAHFGSFFYKLLDEGGASYMLYTLSGVPRAAFAHFPMPRATDLFGPTFSGADTVLIDDVKQDPRYGQNSPYYGMPEGHLPVTSYLAVPVISRSGEVLGGLFFGHPEAGVFTEREARIIEGLAAQTAVAMDNARLYEAAHAARTSAEANEQHYRFLAESIPQQVWTAQPDGALDYINARAEAYFGRPAAATLGWQWQQVIHPADLPGCTARWQHALATGEIYEVEFRLRRSDGTYRWHLARALPLRDGSGQISKWFGTNTDIDDRKRAEEAQGFLAHASEILAASLDYEATLAQVARLVVPHLADWCAVDMLTPDYTIQRLAVAHQDEAKVELSWELDRRYPQDVNGPEGVAKVLRTREPQFYPEVPDELLAMVARDGEHLRMLRELGLRSAMIVPLVARGRTLGAISLIAAESGRLYDAADLAFAQDLAHRVALAVDNARLYREAQEVNRLKDEFLATLSHELRTPLTAVLGWTRLLGTGQFDEPTRARALSTIERNALMQVQLIDDILDVSRIIRGQLRLNVRPTEVAPVVAAAADALRPAAEAKAIRLQTVLDPRAGPVSGDPDRLQQIVWNLLSNAIKFTPKEGRVQVILARVESHLEITVSDTGEGISPEFLPFVFDRFRQADQKTTRTHGGLGLGLAIVRHLVELHGGTVSAESAGVGHGATFRLKLPLLIVHHADGAAGGAPVGPHPTAASAASAALDCPAELEGLRVLVVEDEPDARDLIVAVLTRCQATVRAAANAADGLEQLQRWQPDVLISDIEMPGEDGYSLIRKVRALPPERGGMTPAAALTAYARAEDRMRALIAGFQLHVPKPVEPAELATVVASLAGRAGPASGPRQPDENGTT